MEDIKLNFKQKSGIRMILFWTGLVRYLLAGFVPLIVFYSVPLMLVATMMTAIALLGIMSFEDSKRKLLS